METITLEDFKIKLGKHLRQLRKEAKLTQKELALKIGYKDKQVISNYEVNGANPTAYTLTQLAEALGATTDDILDFSRLD
ncbi:helix-turn-helix transcriptional regulator (plasmid) [Pedobacter sp. BS3]|uniref:helix-turn-helix domain-containing protein n=1 Tax=Pedobacter sp. BS3 TaxID=2567937 RepID=UPI0011EFA40C|nr:helix-turn-helix transcriptional regulator [Pedobacter sp. BS3]TZF85866.1 helix-turn-helix transcriptional regulator [Pedobacter sp. BS3]